ncbi:MAG: hypothetical protein QM764_09105 [Chitinophagaceae bacterium]
MITKTKYSLCLLSILMACNVYCQASGGLDNFHYFNNKIGYSWAPALHLTSKEKIYTSLRYNYEESQTFSAIAGKSFKKGNSLQAEFTPAAGFATGKYNGLVLALNTDLKLGILQFYSQGQYSFGLGTTPTNCYYSWSDLSCKLSNRFSAGFALQQRNEVGNPLISEPGIFAELHFGQWNFPFYYFNSDGRQNTIVAGINLEWEQKK